MGGHGDHSGGPAIQLHPQSRLWKRENGGILSLGSDLGHFEVLDYDPYDDSLHEEEEVEHSKPLGRFKLAFVQWIIFALVGIVSGLFAIAIMAGIEHLTELRFDLLQRLMDHFPGFFPGLAWYLMLNYCVGGTAVIIVSFLGRELGGGGTSDVVSFLNGVKQSKCFRFKTLVGRAICSVMAVSGGFVTGPEAPIIQTGAIVGAGLPQARSSAFGVTIPVPKIFSIMRQDRYKLEAIAAGAAAGMSAAFGAPLAGVFFVLEEAASFWSRGLILRCLFCAVMSKLVLTIFSYGFFTDSLGLFEQPGYLFFGVFMDRTTNYAVVPVTKAATDAVDYVSIWHILSFFIPLAILTGLMGLLYSTGVRYMSILRRKYVMRWVLPYFPAAGKKEGDRGGLLGPLHKLTGKVRFLNHIVGDEWMWVRTIEGLAILTLTGLVVYTVSWTIGTCNPIPVNLQYKVEYNKLNCEEGQYNDLATLLMNSLDGSVKQLWHNPWGFKSLTLLVSSITMWSFLLITNGAAIPFGLLVPSLVIGGSVGRFCGLLYSDYIDSSLDLQGAALIGSIGVLVGNTRLSVTAASIVMETTNNFQFIIPAIIAILISRAVAELLSESVLHSVIHASHAPYLDWSAPKRFSLYEARDIMNTKLACLSPIETVGNIIAFLEEQGHHGFPVTVRFTDSYGQPHHALQGFISRDVICTLLCERVFLSTKPSLSSAPERSPIDLTVFRKTYPRIPTVAQVQKKLRPGDEDLYVDFRRYTNRWPYTVQEAATMPRVFRMFRLLGLRHLIVVNTHGEPTGIITRKDLSLLAHMHPEEESSHGHGDDFHGSSHSVSSDRLFSGRDFSVGGVAANHSRSTPSDSNAVDSRRAFPNQSTPGLNDDPVASNRIV